QSLSTNSSMSFENTLSYILPKLGKHNMDIMVGQSIERSNWSASLSMTASDGADAVNSLVLKGWDYAMMSNFATITGYSGYAAPAQGSIASFFGRYNWNYDEKYMATVTVRGDGSSNFARGNRWGYFPSVSAGWVVSSEDFMQSTSSWMDYLKLRASWGQNGNCNIGNFYYLSNIGFSPTDYADYGYRFGSDILGTLGGVYTTGAYAKNVPNKDVTWETSEQINIGIDARFLNNRLGVNFDWYKKTTKDWLVQAPMNELLGYEEPAYINGGEVENTGVELSLSWRDQVTRDFSYHVNVNTAYNKNEVTYLATASGKIGDGISSALFENSSYVSLVEVGHPIGYFSGMSYSGIWQNQAQIDAARASGKAVLPNAQPGDMIWDDHDKDGTITLDGDRHEIGKPTPDFTLGINLGFTYKGLDFSVAGSGAFGHQIMQSYRTALLANQYSNYTTDVFDRWHGEGTSNTQPRLVVGSENNQWVSTRYMQNADYFKIQNITLGYDFNKLWKNSPFQALRLYVQAQNLYTFTNYTGVDPECGSDGGAGSSWARGLDVGLYPSARTYMVGASIKF
ncbi:SusC/RagA family TonB-linked outer membrane protein, partial [Bacteroides sp. OttesenSCG-928-N06]|nr:SusC/RagA family TonB-linked outer membrane protein [Bacteroides sp. OttesenSCG-928-N06]